MHDEYSAYIWDSGVRRVRLRQRVIPSRALRLFGSEAITVFQLDNASSCCPSSSSSKATSHRTKTSVGQTARSFCSSLRRSILDSFTMKRTHSMSRIDERMGWSTDIRSPDDADPVDSFIRRFQPVKRSHVTKHLVRCERRDQDNQNAEDPAPTMLPTLKNKAAI